MGCHSLDDTYFLDQTLLVPAKATQLSLPPICLRLSKLKRMELDQSPAPELTGVVAWKNSLPLKISDLRGKVVLLDFWGYWCQSCLVKFPKLFELHDKYQKEGLIIIGIHVDAGDNINTVAKLDKKTKLLRDSIWNGRDIPFPVAIVPKKEVPYGAKDIGSAMSEVAASYGIQHYPTQVLIDQNGNVIGRFNINNPSDMKRLENMLKTTPPEKLIR